MSESTATPNLAPGDSGPSVTELQNLLAAKGFSPGAIDGDFGPGTEAAVLAFQNSNGLLADGIVGPRTAIALGMSAASVPAPSGMPIVTIGIAAKMFPGALVSNIVRNLPLVTAALQAASLTTVPIVVAALATIRAETAGFFPLDESISRYNTSPNGAPFDLYDNRADLGNRGAPDGADFKGRGFVQLTGRTNYTLYGPKIGIPNLVDTPEQANDPTIAARLLAAFFVNNEIKIKQALLDHDLAAARRAVNGGSHGLTDFIDAYNTGIAALG
jgi:peptidoglycan L-alanyl-D-glutamate endopeptidase CwlK